MMALAASACRETPVEPGKESTSYRIEGTVTDRYGNAAIGVQVFLYYDYAYVDRNPPPSRSCTVDDSTKPVTVGVFDQHNALRRTLFQGLPPASTFAVAWDHCDSAGVPMPSGVYTVQYLVNGATRASYPVVVDGGQVAVTNGSGKFVVPEENLPVGFYPAPLFTSDSSYFYGNYQITSRVYLAFVTPQDNFSRAVDLLKGQVNVLDVTI